MQLSKEKQKYDEFGEEPQKHIEKKQEKKNVKEILTLAECVYLHRERKRERG